MLSPDKSTCTGGTPTTITEGQLPYYITAASGTNICYSFISPIDSTLPYNAEQYDWSSLTGTGSASLQSKQTSEFTLTSTSSVTANYAALSSFVIHVDSPVNL